MATLDDVARIALSLPSVTESVRHGNRTWFVAGKAFAWERPYSKADLRRAGSSPLPPLPVLAVRVDDLQEKDVILQARGFFSIPHFDGYPAVLVELRRVAPKRLRLAIEDAWLAMAPPALAAEYAAR